MKKTCPASYRLELVLACNEADLDREEAGERVRAACRGEMSVSEFRRSLGLMPELRHGRELHS